MKFIIDIYKITKSFSSEEKFGFISHLRKASVSKFLYFREETSRTTNKDRAHFTTISYNSAMKVLNQLIICCELGFISENETTLARRNLQIC